MSRRRAALLERLADVGRANSDATVLFHGTIARQLELHPTDEKTMSLLQRLGPLTAGQIARHTGLATASVTDLIDRLARRGWVRRIPDPKDRRRVIVEPAAQRVTAAARLFVATRNSLARLYERYSDDELALIADFLKRNAERLREETAKLDRGRSETSLSLIARPDLVHLDRAPQESGADQARQRLPEGVYTGIWWYARFPNHYAGEGAAASRELGAYEAKTWIAGIVQAIRAVRADQESLRLQNEFYERSRHPLETPQ